MILTLDEIVDINQNADFDSAIGYARKIESAVLAKLKAQEPAAWRTFDGEGGYDYRSFADNENYQAEFLARNQSPTYKNWVEALYLRPLPPDDVVRDAERYRWLRADYDSDICVVSGLGAIDYGSSGVAATYETCLCLEELDAAIDAAMEKMK